ncbi:MAG: mechanosensitive ion channel domain-containing protein [Cyanobacteria bacterium P01_F01_bin.33]
MAIELLMIDVLAQVGADTIPRNLALDEITVWKIVRAAICIGIAYASITAIGSLANWLSERVARRFRLTIKQSIPFWRSAILIISFIYILELFINLSSSNLLALSGTVAVALGFAFKDYASSVIAGFVGLFETSYRVGDRIQIGDCYGEVISYGLRSIRLRTPDDNVVTIPHNKAWTDAISNANDGALEAQVAADFYLAHDVDIQLAMRILYLAAFTSKFTHLKLPIVVVMNEKPWGTHFKLRCYPMDARNEFIYKTDLIARAKQAFATYGIRYPSLPSAASLLSEKSN